MTYAVEFTYRPDHGKADWVPWRVHKEGMTQTQAEQLSRVMNSLGGRTRVVAR